MNKEPTDSGTMNIFTLIGSGERIFLRELVWVQTIIHRIKLLSRGDFFRGLPLGNVTFRSLQLANE